MPTSLRPLGLAACIALIAGAGIHAHASQIPFAGALTLTQIGTTATPRVNFNFNGLTVQALPSDSLNGTALAITPYPPGFIMSGPITTQSGFESATFTSSGGTISMGNASTGSLNGDVQFISIFSTSYSPGFFGVQIGLSDVTVTTGSSALIDSWTSSDGNGTLAFSFSSGPQTLSGLLTLGLPGSSFSNPQPDSLQGTIATMPEPASLFLFGSCLLGPGLAYKRRLAAAGASL